MAQHRYFVCLRAPAQDKGLSYEARGLLWYLLSKPDHWEIKIKDLIIKGIAGRDKVYRMLKELKEAGYLHGRERNKRGDGTYAWTGYILHEEPFTEKPDMDDKNPPYPEKPYTGEPYTENQDILESTEGESTEKKKDSIPPADAAELPPLYDNPKYDLVKDMMAAVREVYVHFKDVPGWR